MSSYGRNFEVVVPPYAAQRKGRFFNDGAEFPIGVPVTVSSGGTLGVNNALDQQPVEVVDGAADPVQGQSGIAIYESAFNAYAGNDEVLTTYSDIDTVPAGAALQLISGTNVKVRFTNTVARTFLNTRAYAGRVMVAGIGATPTVAVGDLLTPNGSPTDTVGYWQETSTASEAWLIVTKFDAVSSVIEAQMVF
jgi:hypothetical protein